MSKLIIKPCPFCGRKYRGKIFAYAGLATRFECSSCGAKGPFPGMGDGKKQKTNMDQEYYDKITLKAWNTRGSL